MPMADLLAERDGAFGAAVDSTLLARLDLKLGDRISDRQRQRSRSAAWSTPSRTSSPAMSGSARAFWSAKRACAPPALLQPGSLVRWIYRVKLPDNAADDRAATQLIDSARSALPEAGW